MKVVINTCHGGFGLSDAAYERLIELGIPVRRFVPQKQDPETGLWLPEPLNDGEVIFDNRLGDGNTGLSEYLGAYWDTWTNDNRSHPLLVQVVEELGEAANDRCAALKVIEIPDDVVWVLSEYDGKEEIHEKHRTWS